MNKYFSIFATSFKQERKTITNSLISVVSFAVIIFIFRQLWGYIYGGSGVGQLINGYTLEMMLWYMIVAEILMYSLNVRAVTRSFSGDIKTGKIAYQLNKPYNYFGYQVANQCGAFVWKLCFLLPTGILMGVLMLGVPTGFNFAYLLPMILSIVLGCVLTCLIYGAIGLLAFWVEESTPFAWIVQKFVMLFGLFFPPEFFPSWLQPIITYSPVYAIVSGPSKLIANFSWELCGQVLLTQLVYLVIGVVLGLLIYKSGTKKVNINGG